MPTKEERKEVREDMENFLTVMRISMKDTMKEEDWLSKV
jgi:hypothetical protein